MAKIMSLMKFFMVNRWDYWGDTFVLYRGILDKRGEIFVGQVPESHCFWEENVPLKTNACTTGRPRKFPAVRDKRLKPLSARTWGERLLREGEWKKVKLSLSSKPYTHAIAIRVKEVISETYYRPGGTRWLIVEKYGKNQLKYSISNAKPETSLKQLMR